MSIIFNNISSKFIRLSGIISVGLIAGDHNLLCQCEDGGGQQLGRTARAGGLPIGEDGPRRDPERLCWRPLPQGHLRRWVGWVSDAINSCRYVNVCLPVSRGDEASVHCSGNRGSSLPALSGRAHLGLR